MPSRRHLDPRAQAAIDHLRIHAKVYFGAICPHNLPAVIPTRGQRHSWRDAVTVFLLSELLSVHRVSKGKEIYWYGDLYQINRSELAKQFACDPDEVSGALHWLKALGLVDVIHRTHIDDTGKTRGTQVFAVPRMDRIKTILDYYAQHGRPLTASELLESPPLKGGLNTSSNGSEPALNGASSHLKGRAYLNCAQTQQKSGDVIDGETSLQRPEAKRKGDQRSLAVDGGGGEADAEQRAQVPSMPFAAPPPRQPKVVSKNGHPPVASAALWTPPSLPPDLTPDADTKSAWLKGSLFCQLWAEALLREGLATICKPTAADLKAAFSFFTSHSHTGPHYAMAVAINAWRASYRKQTKRWDRLYHCRQSRELQAFLRSFAAGKLESEIGQLDWEINTWADLRRTFTESELKYYRWIIIPVVPIPSEELWEHDPDAPDYYTQRKLKPPSEVVAAQQLHQHQQDDP